MIHEIPTAPLFNTGSGAARANKVDMIQSVTGEHVSEQKAHDVWKLMQKHIPVSQNNTSQVKKFVAHSCDQS